MIREVEESILLENVPITLRDLAIELQAGLAPDLNHQQDILTEGATMKSLTKIEIAVEKEDPIMKTLNQVISIFMIKKLRHIFANLHLCKFKQ